MHTFGNIYLRICASVQVFKKKIWKKKYMQVYINKRKKRNMNKCVRLKKRRDMYKKNCHSMRARLDGGGLERE